MSWFTGLKIPNAKEVMQESTHRLASDTCSELIKYKDETIQEAYKKALFVLQTKYMTGLSGREIFRAFKLETYFEQGIKFLKTFFMKVKAVKTNEIPKEPFFEEIKSLVNQYKETFPVIQILMPFLPPLELSEERKRELSLAATGSLINKKYRNHTLYTSERILFDFLLASDRYSKLDSSCLQYVYDIILELEEPLIKFYLDFYEMFSYVDNNTGETTNQAKALIKEQLMEWKDLDIFKSILVALFGGEESLRLELKYSGISREQLSLDEALNNLKNHLELPYERLDEIEKVRVHSKGIRAAIEEICKARPRYPMLQTNLQKKTFIRSLSRDERDHIWKSMHGTDFLTFVRELAQKSENPEKWNFDSMSELAFEDCYEELAGEHWTETVFNEMQGTSFGTSESEDMKIVGSVKNIEKYNALEKYFSDVRGSQVKLDKTMRTKALIRGLNDSELARASEILFNTSAANKNDLMKEIERLYDDKELYASAGLESVDEKLQKELKDALPKLESFIEKTVAYILTPAIRILDITILYLNWLRKHVNDIHLVAEAKDVYMRQKGKMTIYSMIMEAQRVFPIVKTDSHLTIALISSLISRTSFEEVLEDLSRTSFVIDEFAQEKIPFNKNANFWTQTNEIWIRHLRRERRVKIKDHKEEKIIETKEEKAQRIYHSLEEALIPYNYALRRPEVSWAPLHLSAEEKILDALKQLINNIELLDVEFVLGREDIEVGDDKTLGKEVILKDVIVKLIEEEYQSELNKTLEKFRNMQSLTSDDIIFIASEIVDVFNKSLADKMPGTIDKQYFDTIREFAKKYVSTFTRSRYKSKSGRDKTLDEILNKMGPDFIKLTKHRDYPIVRGLLGHVFEDSVLTYLKEYNETYSSLDRDKVEEKMARALFGRGLKISYFTKLLNHLLQERRKGSAEIGLDTWIRYSYGCRYVLRRIDKTCYLMKGIY